MALEHGYNPGRRNPVDFEQPTHSIVWRIRLAAEYRIEETAPSLLAVDLSHWNGNVDFAALRGSGVQAVILKCSEAAKGTYYEYKDDTFERNWQAAMDEGFPVMTYHFFRDNKGSMEKDWYMECADAFLNAVSGHTACWLDVEWRNSTVSKDARANRAFGFCDLIRGEGIKQGVYCSPGLVTDLFPAVEPRWGNVFQWNAHWTSAPEPILPNGWSWELIKAWQYGVSPRHSWVPIIQGTPGEVDVNMLYFDSEQDLREWMGEVEPPPEDCCENHELRIATLENGQQVLTEVQQAHSMMIGKNTDAIKANSDGIYAINTELSALTARVVELEETLAKIKEAFCGE